MGSPGVKWVRNKVPEAITWAPYSILDRSPV